MSETDTSKTVRQFTVEPDDEGVRLDRWFKRHLPQIGFATISKWARTGQIRVDGGRVKPDDRLATARSCACRPAGKHRTASPRHGASSLPRKLPKRKPW